MNTTRECVKNASILFCGLVLILAGSSLISYGCWRIERRLNWTFEYGPKVEKRLESIEQRLEELEETRDEVKRP